MTAVLKTRNLSNRLNAVRRARDTLTYRRTPPRTGPARAESVRFLLMLSRFDAARAGRHGLLIYYRAEGCALRRLLED